MPKMKSKSGARKRFTVTGSGKVLRKQQNRRHILTKKASKRKRQLRGTTLVSPAETKRILEMILA